jgi:hypothetical protein
MSCVFIGNKWFILAIPVPLFYNQIPISITCSSAEYIYFLPATIFSVIDDNDAVAYRLHFVRCVEEKQFCLYLHFDNVTYLINYPDLNPVVGSV